MLDISTETVAECKERNGDALEDRPSRIDNTIVSDTIGYNDGEPLVEGVTSYSEYPSKAELSHPEYGDFLRRLFSHDLIGGFDDATAELTAIRADSVLSDWINSVKKAADLHSIDSEDLFADSREEPDTAEAVSNILGYDVEESMLQSNTLVWSALYLVGCSTEEIAELLEIRETDVKDRLKSVNLIGGKTTDEQQEAFREKRGEVNRPSGGVSVNHTAVEESDTVTVVSR